MTDQAAARAEVPRTGSAPNRKCPEPEVPCAPMAALNPAEWHTRVELLPSALLRACSVWHHVGFLKPSAALAEQPPGRTAQEGPGLGGSPCGGAGLSCAGRPRCAEA